MCLHSVVERTQKCERGNQECRWRQIKIIYWWHLDLVGESLRCINSLNAWAANCATFWNQKLYCDTVFLHINDDNEELLRPAIKSIATQKTCFMLRANWTYISRSGRGDSPRPPAPLATRLWICNWTFSWVQFLSIKLELIVSYNEKITRTSFLLCVLIYTFL